MLRKKSRRMLTSLMLTRAKSVHPLLVLAGLMAASLAVLTLLPKIPQDQAYHLFADQRALVGIPNFWNVVSNIPFIVVGAVGLARFRDDAATIVLFLGFFLTGIGSAYYHWDPNDGTLFWDRLPMTISFAAIFSLVVQERMGARVGSILLWPMLAIGVASLLAWLWTDDLRLYFWAQFFPGVALIALFALYPARYTHAYYWLVAASLYALAKLFEFTDYPIYSLGRLLSGHTLKHLSAAAACFVILRYFELRRPIL
jgi:Ceramidase